MLNLIGERYGRLVVIGEADRRRAPCGVTERRFVCRCDCGNIKTIAAQTLRSGSAKSCGCLRREMVEEKNTTHGKSKSKLYRVWSSMKDRCLRNGARQFKDYGGRGISICDEWKNSFESFEKWATANGYAEGLTIERIDNNGNYSPGNCKWIPRSEQSKNRRMNHYLTFNNSTRTIQDWANEIGINRCTLREYCKKYGDENAVKIAIDRKRKGAK